MKTHRVHQLMWTRSSAGTELPCESCCVWITPALGSPTIRSLHYTRDRWKGCFLLCTSTWEDNRNRDQALRAESSLTPHIISLLSHERACMLLEVTTLFLGQLYVPALRETALPIIAPSWITYLQSQTPLVPGKTSSY